MILKVIAVAHKHHRHSHTHGHGKACPCPLHHSEKTTTAINSAHEVQDKVWTAIHRKIITIKPPSQYEIHSILEDTLAISTRRRDRASGNNKPRLVQRVQDIGKIKAHFTKSNCRDTFLGFVGWGERCLTEGLKPRQNISQYQGFLYINQIGETCYQELGSNLVLFTAREENQSIKKANHTNTQQILTTGGRDFNINTNTGIDSENAAINLKSVLGEQAEKQMINTLRVLIEEDNFSDASSVQFNFEEEHHHHHTYFKSKSELMNNVLLDVTTSIDEVNLQTVSNLKESYKILLEFDNAFHLAIPPNDPDCQKLQQSWGNYFRISPESQESFQEIHGFIHDHLYDYKKRVWTPETQLDLPRFPDKEIPKMNKILKKLKEVLELYKQSLAELNRLYVRTEEE